MNVEQAMQALRQTPANPGNLTPSTFANEGQRSAATTTDREQIAKLKARAPITARPGERFEVSLPVYESYVTDATAGNTETIQLSHSIIDTPNTDSIVVWEGGTYMGGEGAFDAIDYANNTVDYTDDATGTTLYLWYISDASADLELQKVAANENGNQGLYNENLRFVHKTNLSEQPEDPDVGKTPLNPVVATNMEIEVYLDAAYTFRWEDPDGNGATPTNLLFSFPVNRAKRQVSGLAQTVSTDMAQE